MKAAIVPLAVLFLFAAVAGAADDAAAKKFLKDLEGSYTPVSMTRSGEAGEPMRFLKTVSLASRATA